MKDLTQILFALAFFPFIMLAFAMLRKRLWWVVALLLLIRALVDGKYKFDLGGVSITSLLGGTIFVVAFFAVLYSGRHRVYLLLAMGFLGSSSALAVSDLGASVFEELVRMCSVVALFYLIRSLPYPVHLKTLVIYIQVVSLLSATASLFQWVTHSGMMVDGVQRAAGTMAHPNSAALLYGIGLTLSVAMGLHGWNKVWNFGCIAVLFAAVVSTGSMGGLVATLVMLTVFALRSRALSSLARGLSILAVGAMLVIFSASSLGQQRLSELDGVNLDGSGREDNSLEWRIGRWGDFLDLWREAPLIGHGYGSTTTGVFLGGYVPHNEYVRVLVECGIVGILVMLVVGALISSRLRASERRQGMISTISSASQAILAGLVVNAFAENTFLYSVPGYICALLLGSCWHIGRHKPPRANKAQAITSNVFYEPRVNSDNVRSDVIS